MQDLGLCLARYGKIGAYSFLQSDLALGEPDLPGVGGATLDDATPVAEVASGTTMPAANLTPERVVVLDDGRIGAVLPAPQPGTEFALVTFVKIDELWMIESIAPIKVRDRLTIPAAEAGRRRPWSLASGNAAEMKSGRIVPAAFIVWIRSVPGATGRAIRTARSQFRCSRDARDRVVPRHSASRGIWFRRS
ncbi:MAG: hypothetical protein R2843_08505 [Thermomicrobiales bacterium]